MSILLCNFTVASKWDFSLEGYASFPLSLSEDYRLDYITNTETHTHTHTHPNHPHNPHSPAHNPPQTRSSSAPDPLLIRPRRHRLQMWPRYGTEMALMWPWYGTDMALISHCGFPDGACAHCC